jgi:hypothetical protein
MCRQTDQRQAYLRAKASSIVQGILTASVSFKECKKQQRLFREKNVHSGTGPHLVRDPRIAQLKTRLTFQPKKYALLSTENTFTHKLTVLCSQTGYRKSASKQYIGVMYTITCRREKTH